MVSRTIGIVTLFCFVAYIEGCSSARFIPLEEYQKKSREGQPEIMAVMTADGTFYEFDLRVQSIRIEGDKLVGVLKDGTRAAILTEDIQAVEIVQFDTRMTLTILGVGCLIFAIMLITVASRGIIIM